MQNTENTISFRLPPEYLSLLKDQAEKEGKTHHEWAKRLLIRMLTETERAELRAEMGKLQKDFKKMRGDLATLGMYLLVKVGEETHEEAQAWVRENLAP